MEWPTIDLEQYEFETTSTSQQIWKRAADAALADITEDQTTLAPLIYAWKEKMEACTNEEEWNWNYRNLIEEFITIMAMASTEQALDMAQAGLDAIHELLLYRIDATSIVPAKDIFILTNSLPKLETCSLIGSKAPDIDFQFGLTNPLNPNNETLYGMDAIAQIKAWHKYGIMETSASVLAKTTFSHNNTSIPGMLYNKVFVLMGCTSELGPAKSLLLIPGITVMGIARGGSKLDKLLDYIRYNTPDDTTFLYPKHGADLLVQGPQLAQWILDQVSALETSSSGSGSGSTTSTIKKELVLIPLACSPKGETNVRLAAVMDMMIQRIMRQRPNTILCHYGSPTTCMVVPPASATMAQKRLEDRPSWEKWTHTVTLGKWLQPSLPKSNNDYAILNGIVTLQGPCYCLAKTIQQWRCMIAYYRDGHTVSAPYAPLTRTQSMIVGDLSSDIDTGMEAVLEGMHHFEPMLAFDSGPASTVMASILISSIQFMNRPLPDMEENPFTMFWDGSVHGGIWTCPYTLESISTINWVLGKTWYPKGYIPDAVIVKKPGQEGYQPEEVVRDPEEVLKEMMNDSEYGKPMPDCVKERLEFM